MILPGLTEEQQNGILRRRCEGDLSFFVEEYVKIEDRDAADIVIPFKLWPKQIEALLLFLTERLIQVLKARQLGLTWLALAYATWCIVFKKGFSVIALSKTDDDAKELVRRVGFILEHLPEWMITKDDWDATKSDVTIKRHTEVSTFKSFPASQNAGRTFTASLVILDEWAFQQWARSIWRAAFPTINRPSGGQVIGLSTIERGTLFEDLWVTSNLFKKIFLGWFADPRRTAKWYEDTKVILQDDALREYPATVEEAFSIPGGAFFYEFRSYIHLKQKEKNIPNWYSRYRVIDYGLDMLACYWIYLDARGMGRIYRELHKEGLVISQASYEILKMSGAGVPKTVNEWDTLPVSERQRIALSATEKIELTYAPPDLFAISSQTGKSSAEVWGENGIDLVKTKNDVEEGCLLMTEWLHPIDVKNEQTGEKIKTARLTVDEDAAPELVKALLSIQKDKNNPKVYAKQPHILTHPIDSIRYFCTEYTYAPKEPKSTVGWASQWAKRSKAQAVGSGWQPGMG